MRASIKKLGIVFFMLLLFFTFLSQTMANIFIPSVKVGYAYSGRITSVIESVAVARKPDTVPLYATVGGKIEEVLVTCGEHVGLDDKILKYNALEKEKELKYLELELLSKKEALIRSVELINNLSASEITEKPYDMQPTLVIENEIQKIKAEIESAEEKIEIYEGLYSAGVISKSEVDELKFKLTALEYDLKSRELELLDIISKNESSRAAAGLEYENEIKTRQDEIEALRQNINEGYAECEILSLKIGEIKDQISSKRYELAPAEGKIAKSYVFPGQIVTENQHIFDIYAKADSNKYEALFELSNPDSLYFSVGMKVDITYENDRINKIEGIVAEIKNAGNAKNTKELLVHILSEEDIDNQAVKLEYNSESEIYDYVVPNSALKYDGRNYYILMVETEEKTLGAQYTARKLPVYVTAQNSEAAALKNAYGLEGKIIFESGNKVTDGEKVYVINE